MEQISARELARIGRVVQALLSPLDYPHVDAWRSAVNHELCALLGADSAGFLLPVTDAAPMFSNEHSAEVLAPFPELLPPDLSDGTPIWQRMIETGTGTLDTMYGADMPLYLGSAYYNEYAARGGGAETLASSILVTGSGTTPIGAASLHLWHSVLGGRRFGEHEVALLSMLYPAFRAGVESWQRFHTARSSLLVMIDQMDEAAIVVDGSDRVVHETPSVARMLADDPEGETVRSALLAFALTVPTEASRLSTVRFCRELRTRTARYEIHGFSYAAGAINSAVRLVVVKRKTPRARTNDELCAEFGFTAAEATVARLIASGLRNAAIAEVLGTSVHTVKRHVERVMQKLGVRARAEVGPRIA